MGCPCNKNKNNSAQRVKTVMSSSNCSENRAELRLLIRSFKKLNATMLWNNPDKDIIKEIIKDLEIKKSNIKYCPSLDFLKELKEILDGKHTNV